MALDSARREHADQDAEIERLEAANKALMQQAQQDEGEGGEGQMAVE
jgi:cell division protein FtsB